MQSIVREHIIDGKKVELNLHVLFCFLKNSPISTLKESLVDRQIFGEYSGYLMHMKKIPTEDQ